MALFFFFVWFPSLYVMVCLLSRPWAGLEEGRGGVGDSKTTRANFLVRPPPHRKTPQHGARPGRPEHVQCRVQMQAVQQLEIQVWPQAVGAGRGGSWKGHLRFSRSVNTVDSLRGSQGWGPL